jgi:hypothetical protein
MLNLHSLLYNDKAKRQLFGIMADEFRRMHATVKSTYDPSLIYQSVDAEPMPPVQSKQVRDKTLATILQEITPSTSHISLSSLTQFIIKNLQWAATECTSKIVLTYYVLVMFYISPQLRSMVMANSERGLAESWFYGFEERMTRAMCGTTDAEDDAPKGQPTSVIDACHTPIEIVLNEWRRFDICQTTPEVCAGPQPLQAGPAS